MDSENICAVTLPICGVLVVFVLAIVGFQCDRVSKEKELNALKECVKAGGSYVFGSCVGTRTYNGQTQEQN